MDHANELFKTIALMKNENEVYFTKLRNRLDTYSQQSSGNLCCFFTHSFLLSNDLNEKQTMIGSFSINNISLQSISFPTILIHINSETPIDFSGNYTHENQENGSQNNTWIRINKDKEQAHTHYWLKPVGVEKILPGEMSVFNHFQIGFSLLEPNNIIIDGFGYCAEKPDGVHSLNTIQFVI